MGNTACGAGGGGLSQGGRKGSVAGRSGVERRRGERGEIAPVFFCFFFSKTHLLVPEVVALFVFDPSVL